MYAMRIKNTGEVSILINKKEDDIFKVLLNQVGLTKGDVEFYQLCENCCAKAHSKGMLTRPVYNNGVLTVEEYESVIEDPNNPGQPLWQNLIATHSTLLLDFDSLYDENGDFVEPPAFVPGE
jgi:hypothetical protein